MRDINSCLKPEKSVENLGRRVWRLQNRLGVVLATLALLGLSSTAQAALLTVNLSGVDLRFKGSQTDIVDDVGDVLNGPGNMDPNIADNVDAATFKSGGAVLDDWMAPSDEISLDLLIEDSLGSLAPNTPTALPLAGGTNQLVWFVDDGTYLRIDLDDITVTRTTLPFGLPEIFQMVGSATVVGNQVLPGGMMFAGAVGIAYVSTEAMFVNGDMEGFASTGVLTITGTMVPEPSTFALAGLSLMAIVAGYRRRD